MTFSCAERKFRDELVGDSFLFLAVVSNLCFPFFSIFRVITMYLGVRLTRFFARTVALEVLRDTIHTVVSIFNLYIVMDNFKVVKEA